MQIKINLIRTLKLSPDQDLKYTLAGIKHITAFYPVFISYTIEYIYEYQLS